jgi:poly(3-hydroxybutyrate) depolymerase
MVRKLICILVASFFLGQATVFSQTVAEKVIYYQKGADTLWFLHYEPLLKSNGISVLFVHGGAFTGGDPMNQEPFAKGLTKLGYNVFVIKYRLYLKGKSFGCQTPTPEKLKAIETSVEDISAACDFIFKNASRYGADTSKFFIAGSSAGAEAVMNLVFNPFVQKKGSIQKRFSGVLSFAGALLDINTLSEKNWIPVFMMHGTNDQLVPYGTAAHHFCKATDPGWLMMFGPSTILKEAKKKKLPAILYAYEGRGHEVSNYMFRNFKEMDDFMLSVAKKEEIKPTIYAR